jgi:2-keto-4-pentenoate hydratase/2-oxohepta-3-ene-1,7-dioic acid hydratase in catechol pathway
MGPVLVSPDELDDPNHLELVCEVNGEIRQKDVTSDLIFDVPTLVSYLSNMLTLQPGDVIFTGTPGGVGVFQKKLLKEGDVIRTSISGLGSIENRCVRGPDHPHADFLPPQMAPLFKTD